MAILLKSSTFGFGRLQKFTQKVLMYAKDVILTKTEILNSFANRLLD